MSKPVESVAPEELLNVVAGAASQDPRLVMTSADRLKQMLDMHGTFDCLSAIACQRSLPVNVRQQSIIQLKNVALSHWKARRLISEEQKADIRTRSLTLLDEEDDTIAECNKHIIAKIARQDFPAAWPSLINDLLSSSDNSLKAFVDSGGNDQSGALILRRSLEVINAVLKELSSVRMPSGLKTMGQLIGNMHNVLEGYYATLSNIMVAIVTAATMSTSPASNVILLSHLAYKCICKMAIWTWNRAALKSYMELLPWVESFFSTSATQLRNLSELRIALATALGFSHGSQPSDPYSIRSIDYLTRHIRQFGKLFRRMQQLSSANFVSIQASSELVLYYWSKVVQATNGPSEYIADSQRAVFPVRFLVQAMAIFKESLGKWSLKRGGIDGASTFSQEFVEEAVKLLITRFIPLNPNDLNAWSADPEEWMNMEDKENEQWEYELRPCAERVLVALANHYEAYVVPLVQAIFGSVAVKPATGLDEIVQKEAIYCAIGRCAVYLENKLPFDEWISQNLVLEAKDTNPAFPIIKRRISWVLGKLVSDECIRPQAQIWDILLHLLSDRGSGSDLAVRFASALAIGECVDSLKFDMELFNPYLSAAISQLIELTTEVDTLETKRRISRSLNLIIERSAERIVPYIGIIADQIPSMWMSAENDFLYKAALLETVTKLVEASKDKSTPLNKITVPLLRESLTDSESRAALDQDALNLWISALRNAVTLANNESEPSLLELFPIAISLLSENLDLLGSITAVVESYFVLDSIATIQTFGVPLFRAYLNALGKAVQTNQKDLIRALRTLVQLCPAQLWAEPIHQTHLFAYLVKAIMDDKADVALLTDYILLFARVAINDSLILSQLLSASASVLQRPETDLWEGLLDQWWRRFDNMHEPRQRKLVAMGIAGLVASGRPEVLQRLSGEIFNLWLDVFGEMKEALQDLSHADPESTLSRLITFWRDNGSILPSELDEIQDTPEYERWTRIYQSDQVETAKLTAFVAEKLKLAQQIYGNQFETKFLQDADPAVVKQLNNELNT